MNVLAVAWDPTIRGLLTVAVGVVVLMGSVYLIVGTNVGTRLGFLISAAGFFGWMAIMGIIWMIYGIGMLGTSPSWEIVDVNTGDLQASSVEEAKELDLTVVPDADELNSLELPQFQAVAEEIDPLLGGGWRLLPASDPQRGEAQATVDEYFAEGNYPGIDGAGDYVSLNGYDVGGKPRLGNDPSRWDRIRNWVTNTVRITHPTHYALLEVQQVVEVTPVPGEAPPIPEADETKPVISVIMVRDLGDRRFPAAMITLGSTLIFGLLCYMLHVRDRVLDQHLAAAGA